MKNFQSKTALIWSIAELLRGGWKQYEYQDVVLPLTVLRRLDCVLEPTKAEVLKAHNQHHGKINTDPILKNITKVGFYNTSPYTFESLLEDQTQVAKNLKNYINGFSPNLQEIIQRFDFDKQLERLEGGNLLYLIVKRFVSVDLHPDSVSNMEMGYVFEELIRKFSEQSNETAGEHYTPREVIQLMVEIMFTMDKDKLAKDHVIKRIYDPCCGTGGMLSVSKDFIQKEINPKAEVYLYGQELNPVTWAICNADMLIKGELGVSGTDKRIKGGEKDHAQASTLSNDQFHGENFDYIIANPPYGVDWNKDKQAVENEAAVGHAGRFGAGTPRSSDGQLLFLQHMVSKMQKVENGGSRIAVVFNGSPLFTGSAASGESEIRRWVLENDYLEAVVALPDQLFYNTGISTYLWFLTNRKSEDRKGKVQLIDARKMFKKMRKSLGNKRHEISPENRKAIMDLYANYEENDECKIMNTTDFGYRQITIDRPLRQNYQVSEERLEAIKTHKRYTGAEINPDDKEPAKKKKLAQQAKAREALEKYESEIEPILKTIGDEKYDDRAEFLLVFDRAFVQAGFKLDASTKKIILGGLSEQDENAEICRDKKGKPEPDSDLRDTENVPLGESIEDYFEKEVKPYAPLAWIDTSAKKRDHKDQEVGKVGYEIPVTRYFYQYTPPRNIDEIEHEIEAVENDLLAKLQQLAKDN